MLPCPPQGSEPDMRGIGGNSGMKSHLGDLLRPSGQLQACRAWAYMGFSALPCIRPAWPSPEPLGLARLPMDAPCSHAELPRHGSVGTAHKGPSWLCWGQTHMRMGQSCPGVHLPRPTSVLSIHGSRRLIKNRQWSYPPQRGMASPRALEAGGTHI